ncbi:MAG: carbohydrate kinase [Firmicutes bacterium HGW-Firmicutes-14]|nr:MAG: carbohydrate kinase [Firmicutes bacterium HGW-Firmicutes-14]
MGDAYFIGVDAGTTVIKTVLFNDSGEELASASCNVPVMHPNPGWAEQDMDAVWEAAKQTIKEVVAKSALAQGAIKGLGICGQGGGSWFIGKNGLPLRPAALWLDGRTKSTIESWQKSDVYEKLFQVTGWQVYTGVGPCTILPWFVANEPETLSRAQAVCYCKDWIKYCLTGEISTDETDLLAMTDPRTRDYSPEIFRLAGLSDWENLLPAIIPSSQIAGRITRKAAEETGLPVGTPVASGSIDVAATALGVGCVSSGDAASILGTAAIHLVVSDRPEFSRSYSISQHCVPDTWLFNCMAMMGASCLDWFDREFCLVEEQEAKAAGINKYDLINQKAAGVPIGSNGVIFLPFLQGERAPFVKPEARGDFFGLGDWTKRADLLRAVYEGVTLATMDNHRSLSNGAHFDEFWLAGGGSKSVVWSQIVSDATGKRVKVPLGSEFGARGSVINAAVAVGYFSDHAEAVKNMVRVNRVHEPVPENTEQYAELYVIYRELIEKLWDVWPKIYRYTQGRK